MKDYIEIILGFFALVGVIYRIAQAESSIYKAIDALKDSVSERVSQQEHLLQLHLVEWQEKKEVYTYRFNSLEQLIKHKFDRLSNWIKQVGGFLNKQSGFIIRDDEW